MPNNVQHETTREEQIAQTIEPVPKVQCPFVYASGKGCNGHIVRVEAYKADLSWSPSIDGGWKLSAGEPRSHYHLFCSEKGNHAGASRPDSEQMKRYLQHLPAELLRAIIGSC